MNLALGVTRLTPLEALTAFVFGGRRGLRRKVSAVCVCDERGHLLNYNGGVNDVCLTCGRRP